MATGRHSPSADIEDFLYHVYKGSESLADGRLDSARASLDSALRMQPKDPAAQDLLGKLYFKLGVYPRAIELYQEIVKQFPDSLPPRINLALAYLKTAQLREAIAHLLPVIERDPNHVRAWGYLGLCWSRLSEYAKAKEAFVRAGQDAMALRMEQALEAQYGSGSSQYHTAVSVSADAPRVVESEEIDTSALDPGVLRVAPDTETAPGRWTMHAHGEPILDDRVLPTTLASWASKNVFAPVGRTIEELQQTIVAHEGCAIRAPKSAFGMGWTRGHAVRRRDGEAIDGAAPLLWVGAGWCAVPHEAGQWRTLLALRDEGLIVLERHVLAFDGGLHMEPLSGRDQSLPALSFVGRGIIALSGDGALSTLHCKGEDLVVIHLESLVAFTPGMLHSLEGGMVTIKGDGMVAVQTVVRTKGETR